MRRFIKKLIIFIIPFFIFFCVPCFVYYCSGEHISISDAYKRQNKSRYILYSKAYSNMHNMYAFYNVVQQKPKMLILGSSRVNTFIPDDFNVSCYNANTNGIGMQYYLSFLENLEANSALPEVLLFGPDQWFFNSEHKIGYDIDTDIAGYLSKADKIVHINTYAIKQIWSDLLIPKKINISKIFSSNHIGLSAKQHNSGWDFKGSSYDNTFIPQNKCSYVKEYHQNILNQIKTNIVFDSDYIVADKINETEWVTLLNIINYCEKKNIRLLIFLPPFSPEIYEAMITSGQYEYLTDLQTRLMLLENEKNFQLFDFTYMPETKPENFSDGHHGDPFVYRIITDKILSVYNKQL